MSAELKQRPSQAASCTWLADCMRHAADDICNGVTLERSSTHHACPSCMSTTLLCMHTVIGKLERICTGNEGRDLAEDAEADVRLDAHRCGVLVAIELHAPHGRRSGVSQASAAMGRHQLRLRKQAKQ